MELLTVALMVVMPMALLAMVDMALATVDTLAASSTKWSYRLTQTPKTRYDP